MPALIFFAIAAPSGSQPALPSSSDADGLSLERVVALALANDPNIALAELRIDFAAGSLLIERSVFDPLLTNDLSFLDLRSPQVSGDVAENQISSIGADASTLLPTGLSLDGGIDVERQEPPAGFGFDTTTYALTLRQPLLRDRGRRVVAAGVLSAREELDATAWDRVDQVARRIAAAVTQYWQVVAAIQDLRILEASEDSSRELLENTQRLIEADLVPAADRVLLEADLLSKETSIVSAERALYAAIQDLALALGTLENQGQDLPLPNAQLPIVSWPLPQPFEEPAPLVSWAFGRRAELLAAGRRLEAAQIREQAAENGLLPRLDVLLTPRYETLEPAAGGGAPFPTLSGDVSGFSTTVGLGLSLPLFNRGARGRLIQQRSLVEQQLLQVELVREDIIAGVRKALDATRSSAEQVEKAVRAVGLFEEALSNEEKKLRAGSSTLLDVINQRDRLTSIERQEIQARLSLALALLDLRFQTGSLVEVEGSELTIPVAALRTLPTQTPAGQTPAGQIPANQPMEP